MAHLLEDIVDSFKHFRVLRNIKLCCEPPLIRKGIKSGDYGVFDARLPEEINKIKEIKNENGI